MLFCGRKQEEESLLLTSKISELIFNPQRPNSFTHSGLVLIFFKSFPIDWVCCSLLALMCIVRSWKQNAENNETNALRNGSAGAPHCSRLLKWSYSFELKTSNSTTKNVSEAQNRCFNKVDTMSKSESWVHWTLLPTHYDPLSTFQLLMSLCNNKSKVPSLTSCCSSFFQGSPSGRKALARWGSLQWWFAERNVVWV